ncbi:hypothetical protein HMI54_008444 [Coelomomyces lativittatus]|nr:hypothetical protein HMI54_008444 [Coelomomyces lativittatus]
MVKGTYQLLSQLTQPDQQAILFVPTKSSCTLVASEILAWMNPEQTFLSSFSSSTALDVVDASKLFDSFDTQLQDALNKGMAWIHENMHPQQVKWILYLYQSKIIQVLLSTRKACWMLEKLTCYHVFILSTQYHDGQHHVDADYPIADVLHMIGRSTHQCHLMTTPVKKEHYKRYLHEPVPVESQLDQRTLLDPMNADIVTKTIENKQAAVDYLTWTLMYRRMTLNPNYYGLTGITERHLSDFLSDLIESVVQDLVNAKCIICEDDFELLPLNLGMIAAYYYVSTETIEMFYLSLKAQTKLRGLLDIVSHAIEFSYLPIKHGEKRILQKLYTFVCSYKFSSEELKFSDPHIKAHILLQAHFSRVQLSDELQGDLNYVLEVIVPLIYALVDVISSQGWLGIALFAMELCQMVVQGIWSRDSPLKQIPHFTSKIIDTVFKPAGISNVFDLMELEEDQQTQLFSTFEPHQMKDIANFVNQYPNIELDYQIEDEGEGVAQVPMGCKVHLKREEEQPIPDHVIAPLFPSSKIENWWLVIGDASTKELFGIKRVTLMRELSTRLEFVVPKEGKYQLTLYLMCDSYLGCDQEYEFQVNVVPNEDEDEEEYENEGENDVEESENQIEEDNHDDNLENGEGDNAQDEEENMGFSDREDQMEID